MNRLWTLNILIHTLVPAGRRKENTKANLNKPSGSKGARHQLGASSRIGPSPGELNVHSFKTKRNIIRTILFFLQRPNFLLTRLVSVCLLRTHLQVSPNRMWIKMVNPPNLPIHMSNSITCRAYVPSHATYDLIKSRKNKI